MRVEVKDEEVMIPVPTKMIHLILTEEEAETLLAVSRCIAGDERGRRGHMDSIVVNLSSAGVRCDHVGIADSERVWIAKDKY